MRIKLSYRRCCCWNLLVETPKDPPNTPWSNRTQIPVLGDSSQPWGWSRSPVFPGRSVPGTHLAAKPPQMPFPARAERALFVLAGRSSVDTAAGFVLSLTQVWLGQISAGFVKMLLYAKNFIQTAPKSAPASSPLPTHAQDTRIFQPSPEVSVRNFQLSAHTQPKSGWIWESLRLPGGRKSEELTRLWSFRFRGLEGNAHHFP